MNLRIAWENDLPAIVDIMRQTPWEKSEYLQRQLSSRTVIVAHEGGVLLGA